MKIELDRLDMPDADVMICPAYLSVTEADAYFAELMETVDWKTKSIRMFGKWVVMPRLSAWYGDPSAVYTYSGLTETPISWTDPLLKLCDRLNGDLGLSFNSVLANLYRNGLDSMGLHADDEKELGPEPIIASISLGANRKFRFKHRRIPGLSVDYLLPHGSLLLMAGATQTYWKHELPKSRTMSEPRINLTYRTIMSAPRA